jgi:hypothetical protein
MTRDLAESGVGREMLFPDAPGRFIEQDGVFEDEKVYLEDAGVLGADGVRDARLKRLHFMPRSDQRLFEPVDLGRDIGFPHFATG